MHEVAHQLDPGARVAYLDVEPVAVAHAEAVLADEQRVTITRADVRDPDSVLGAPGVADLLDLTRPVALLAVAVLHFIGGDITDLFARYRSVLVPGSAVVISHGSDDHDDPDLVRRIRGAVAVYGRSATPGTLRSRTELYRLLDGLDMVEPGLVMTRDWPEPRPGLPGAGPYAAVARVTAARPAVDRRSSE